METTNTTPTYLIRPGRIEDADRLREIDFECCGKSAVPLSQLRWLLEGQGEAPSFQVRVAYEHEEDGTEAIMGFVCWKVREQQDGQTAVEILDLSVGKNFREERVEHVLIDRVAEEATKDGRLGISVNVPQANVAAISFYLQLGFNVAHSVDHYYGDGTKMDVLVRRTK
jgi:ribosomal protein S18 acetylase RimI-like enzyme